MQVLANLVDELYRVTQRHRDVLRQNRRILLRLHRLVARPRHAAYLYSTLFEQSLQHGRRVLRWLFDCENQFPRRALGWHRTFNYDETRPGSRVSVKSDFTSEAEVTTSF